jgi:hypothetical protein
MAELLWLVRQILRATIRIEAKLDQILERTKGEKMWRPLSWKGAACPLCMKPVEYALVTLEGASPEIIRKCGCKPQTDKLPEKPEA